MRANVAFMSSLMGRPVWDVLCKMTIVGPVYYMYMHVTYIRF